MDVSVERTGAVHRDVYTLIEQFRDKTRPHLRIDAALALENLGDVRAVGALVDGLSDEDPEIRKCSAKVLITFRSVRSVDALIERLNDINECRETRRFAAESLKKIGGFRAAAALAEYRDEIVQGMPAMPGGDVRCEEVCTRASSTAR